MTDGAGPAVILLDHSKVGARKRARSESPKGSVCGAGGSPQSSSGSSPEDNDSAAAVRASGGGGGGAAAAAAAAAAASHACELYDDHAHHNQSIDDNSDVEAGAGVGAGGAVNVGVVRVGMLSVRAPTLPAGLSYIAKAQFLFDHMLAQSADEDEDGDGELCYRKKVRLSNTTLPFFCVRNELLSCAVYTS